MKKLLALILSALILFPTVTLLNSCSNPQKPDTTETDSETTQVTESKTETETETFPPVEGTSDPDAPLFSRYAVGGNYYAYLERYTKNGFSVKFDIQARKMNIINPKGGATICSYDKNYFLTRVDMAESVITISNEVSESGLLLNQKIVYRNGGREQNLTLSYEYDEEDRISGMTLTDHTSDERILDTEFLYCGSGSYLIRDRSSNAKTYYHLNYLLTEDPVTELHSEVQKNGDLNVIFSVGPYVNKTITMTRTGGECCKMYNEFCQFTAMFSRLNF